MPTLHAGTSIVSLTESQLKALGFVPGQKPQKIGCGKDACAYLGKSADAVVKITKSESDALACYLLSQAGAIPRWSAPVHAVYRIKSAYAICVAKVEPLNTKWAEPIDELYESAKEEDLDPEEWKDFHTDCLREVEWLEAEHAGATESDRNMRRSLELVDEAIRGLEAMGFDWFDWHSDNWGIYKEHPVLIDLGRLESRDGSSIQDRAKKIPVLPF